MFKKLFVLLISTTIALGASELALRQWVFKVAEEIPGYFRLCLPCSYIFEPSPNVPGHNSFGFRGPEISLEKTPGRQRLLFVGDSVTHGHGVLDSEAFPSLVQAQRIGVETINAGVSGYSTFNEVNYLRDNLMRFKPDVIFLQTCMNDIDNPYFSWNDLTRVWVVPPKAAFSNPSQINEIPYHVSDVARVEESIFGRSVLYVLLRMFWLKFESFQIIRTVRDGKWPTYISHVTKKDLKPYLDYDSAEWQWTRYNLDQIKSFIGNTRLVLLIFPLQYELQEGYPFNPEENFMRYCRERGLECLNMREVFKGHKPEDLYMMSRPDPRRIPDVWHLSAEGHRVVAQALINSVL